MQFVKDAYKNFLLYVEYNSFAIEKLLVSILVLQMKKHFFIFLIFISTQTLAQDFPWWANLVKWDGVSPWQRYIITNPGYLGPNALPVPFIRNGSIDSINSIALTGNLHFSKGR